MIARQVATVFGIGLLPGAPGTWGSLAAIPLTWALHWLGGFPLVAGATVVLFAVGSWAAHVYAAPGTDPAEVVIDEVVGMMLALWPLSYGMAFAQNPQAFPWPGWVVGFLVFRFFDIVKPPPVSWADNLDGWLGIMLDDVVAGVLTAAVSLLAAGVAHGWF